MRGGERERGDEFLASKTDELEGMKGEARASHSPVVASRSGRSQSNEGSSKPLGILNSGFDSLQ